MTHTLEELDDDTLICIFAALTIPGIQTFRQVWLKAFAFCNGHPEPCRSRIHILSENMPFPATPLSSLSARELQRRTIRAYHLAQNWRSPNTRLRLLRTVAGGIDVAFHLHPSSDWATRSYAVVELLSLVFEDSTSRVSLQRTATLQSHYKPITLRGDIIALSDHDSETIIMNWKTGEQCLLSSPDTWQQDNPLHVTFVEGNIFVVRARSVCVFKEPPMALQQHDADVPMNIPQKSTSFGWVDGISLSEGSISQFPERSRPSLSSILVRTKGDDPWSLKDQFQLFTVSSGAQRSDVPPTEASRDGHFPEAPTLSLTASITCPNRGPLRCSDMVLGRYGTALWVLPADRSVAGLISEHVHLQSVPVPTSCQTLILAVFPGPLNHSSEAEIKVSMENEDGSSWLCLDYDEERGLIVLGSSTGNVTMLSL
ncbi:hypothetical protein ID866_1984 [Astraeus odoratus]|nr:hypothetical protein ID866_1984 [Astraeus odoratus]